MAAAKARKKPEPDALRRAELTRKKPEPVEPEPAAAQRARPRVSGGSGDELGAAEVARRVADGLKHFRKMRGLSLDDLASRSGVSRAA
ncbi:MAG TPA: helix-turn-helix transcriptional regulator, partial [Polyangiaceae bacterium]|nr:helix-turn-helix transcriptional regulator [Polyangiaceae bacterium]